MIKIGAAAAAGIAVGFVIGKKMAGKGPSNFGERVAAAKAKVECISPAEAKEYIKTCKPLIVDVRDSGDVASGIEGAWNCPISNLVFKADPTPFVLPVDVKVKGEVKIPK